MYHNVHVTSYCILICTTVLFLSIAFEIWILNFFKIWSPQALEIVWVWQVRTSLECMHQSRDAVVFRLQPCFTCNSVSHIKTLVILPCESFITTMGMDTWCQNGEFSNSPAGSIGTDWWYSRYKLACRVIQLCSSNEAGQGGQRTPSSHTISRERMSSRKLINLLIGCQAC